MSEKSKKEYKAKVDKPTKKPKWMIKMFDTATVASDPIKPLINKWIKDSGAYQLWKIKDEIKNEISKLVIWVGDTGVNVEHPQLKPLYVAGILTGKSYHGESWKLDPNGHGTHTLSNIVSYNALSEIVSKSWIVLSILPHTVKEIRMCKVLTDGGQGIPEWLEEMFDDALKLPEEKRPHIISLSLSAPAAAAENPKWKRIMEKVNLLSKTTLVVCAAGNLSLANFGDNAVGVPAKAEEAYAISNMDTLVSANWTTKYGPEIDIGFFGKTQIGAAGTGDGYTIKTGTSMATPATAACLAFFLCCMWHLGMSVKLSIEFVGAFLRSRKLVYDTPPAGEDDMTGMGVLYIEEGYNLLKLITPDSKLRTLAP